MPSSSDHTLNGIVITGIGSSPEPRNLRAAGSLSENAGDTAPTDRRRRRRRSVVGAASIVLALTGAVAAVAYFLSGTGSGTATTGSISGLTISNGTSAALLLPGGSTALNVLVSNANSSALGINTITLDTAQGTGGFSIDAAHVTAGCSVASAALTFATQTTGWTVAAGASSAPLALGTNPLSMGASAPSACQGASISVFLKAT